MNKIMYKLIYFIVISTTLCSLFNLSGCKLFEPLPTDAQLNAIYLSHQKELAELVTMLGQDKRVIAITYTFYDKYGAPSRSKGNFTFTDARWAQYLRLMQEIGCESINRRTRRGTIYFTIGSNGSVISSTSKGFAYSQAILSPIVKSLDISALFDKAQKSGRMEEAFVQINQEWYLFGNAY